MSVIKKNNPIRDADVTEMYRPNLQHMQYKRKYAPINAVCLNSVPIEYIPVKAAAAQRFINTNLTAEVNLRLFFSESDVTDNIKAATPPAIPPTINRQFDSNEFSDTNIPDIPAAKNDHMVNKNALNSFDIGMMFHKNIRAAQFAADAIQYRNTSCPFVMYPRIAPIVPNIPDTEEYATPNGIILPNAVYEKTTPNKTCPIYNAAVRTLILCFFSIFSRCFISFFTPFICVIFYVFNFTSCSLRKIAKYIGVY